MDKKNTWDENYYAYLTEKIDSGISTNPVIKKICNFINNNLSNLSNIRILDMGCFTGSILNQIYLNSNPNIKNKLILVGLDKEEEALKRGSKNFSNITYVKEDFSQTQKCLVQQYDVVILSNVLHEIFSNGLKQDIQSSYKRVKDVINYAGKLIRNNGILIILDGFMPKKSNKKIKIGFNNKDYVVLFKTFLNSYKAYSLYAKFISETEVQTNIATIAVFLAKYRYIYTSYWKNEAKQLYQFIKIEKIKSILKQSGFLNVQIELQTYSNDLLNNMFNIFPYEEDFPIKNVLITSFKDSSNFLS